MNKKQNKLRVKDRGRYFSPAFIAQEEKAINDIDEKGTIRAYISAFNNRDKVGDVILPTAFNKTIKENFNEIYHYLNHDYGKTVGVITELKPDDYGLLMTSKLMLNTPEGNFAYEWYKANKEANKPVMHSIGYVIVDEEYSTDRDAWVLKDLFLAEGSTLTKPPANSNAVSVDVKSFENKTVCQLLQERKVFEAMLNAKLSDVELVQLEKIYNKIESEIKSRKSEPSSDIHGNTLDFLNKLNNSLKI